MSIVTGPVIGAIGGFAAMAIGKRLNQAEEADKRTQSFLINQLNELTKSSSDLDVAYHQNAQYYSKFKDEQNHRTIIRDRDPEGQKVISVSYPDSENVEFLYKWNPKTNKESIKHYNKDGVEDTKVYLAQAHVRIKKEIKLRGKSAAMRRVMNAVSENPQIKGVAQKRAMKRVEKYFGE